MLPRHVDRCPACWSPVDATALPVVTTPVLENGTTPCGKQSSLLCFSIDVVTLAVCVTAGMMGVGAIVHAATSAWSSTWMAIGAGLGLIAGVWATLAVYRRHGRGLGGLITGVRVVDQMSFLPAMPFIPHGPEKARPIMLDIRHGRDPVISVAQPWTGLTPLERTPVVDATRPLHPRHGAPQGSVVLVFDSGQTHWFTGACMVGRSPVAAFGEDILSLPDLVRQLSPNHVEIRELEDESGQAQLWVTDQGSATGTWLEKEDGIEQLPPKLGVRIQPGTRMRLGENWLKVEWGES